MDLIVAPSDEENEDGIDDLMEALDLELHESKMAETDQKKETQSKESVKKRLLNSQLRDSEIETGRETIGDNTRVMERFVHKSS